MVLMDSTDIFGGGAPGVSVKPGIASLLKGKFISNYGISGSSKISSFEFPPI